MTHKEAIEYRRKIEHAADSQTDEDALQSIDLFPAWEAGIEVSKGERYRHEGILYRVIQPHTTQPDWTPDKTPALFAVVSLDEWPEWVQPTSAETAYNTGDKVTFEGKHYVSLIDNNTWSPAVYPAGWQEQA